MRVSAFNALETDRVERGLANDLELQGEKLSGKCCGVM